MFVTLKATVFRGWFVELHRYLLDLAEPKIRESLFIFITGLLRLPVVWFGV
jgi:hypothetical protein